MIAIVPVRFSTNANAASVWSADTFTKWMQPLIPFSLGDFWLTSGRGFLPLECTVYPPVVMNDPRPNVAKDNATQRGALVNGAIAAATAQVAPDWDDTDILLLWYAQPTDMFGGGKYNIPLRAGGSKPVPVTVVDIASPYDSACQELGHSFGFDHELDDEGREYASPYSVMSARLHGPEFLRVADARLPDGQKIADPRDPFFNQPAQHIVGPTLAAAQLLKVDAFKNSPGVIQLSRSYAQQPATLTLFALNYTVRQPPGPLPVLATFPSNTGDGRIFTLEFRRGGHGYDAAIGQPGSPAGLVIHSYNPDGRVRYEGVADVSLAAASEDWASRAGDFSLRLLAVDQSNEFVRFTLRGGARKRFPIRGVLLAGRFRTQHELKAMSHDDMRNTLIVELANRSSQNDFQRFDNDTLAGMGASLVFLREAKIRDDRTLKTMSADDMRNTLIVEIGSQTGLGSQLQGFSSMDLVLIGLGSDLATKGTAPGVLSSFIRGALLAGNFRTQRELNQMSRDDQRNTLIVEMTKHSNQTNYQAFSDAVLEGMGAAMVALRSGRMRDDSGLKTMSADDQRNTLIVEMAGQTQVGIPQLQGMSNMDLVLTALGIEPV